MKKNKIKKLREEMQLTQEQFAKELEISVISVSYYENGKKAPGAKTISKIIKLAKRYRIVITLDDLLEK